MHFLLFFSISRSCSLQPDLNYGNVLDLPDTLDDIFIVAWNELRATTQRMELQTCSVGIVLIFCLINRLYLSARIPSDVIFEYRNIIIFPDGTQALAIVHNSFYFRNETVLGGFSGGCVDGNLQCKQFERVDKSTNYRNWMLARKWI